MAKPVQRSLDVYFIKYNQIHENPVNRVLTCVCILLILFSFFGMIWSLPFPTLNFLGRYNSYINWFTIVFGVVMYYYYKQSPVLTYAVLLGFFFFSVVIVSLEKLHTQYGWPPMGTVCMIILVIALLLQFFSSKMETTKLSLSENLRFLLLGPLWVLHFAFKKIGIRY